LDVSPSPLQRAPAKASTAPTETVGLALPHDSAGLHVLGSAQYVDDMREPIGTLHVAPGYARETCGRILRLDLDPVRSSPGVVAVLTAGDIPGVNDCSPAAGDDPILAAGSVAFHGQVVFAVVARSRDEARLAASRAVIEVEPGAPVVTVEDALAAGSEVLPSYEFARGDTEDALKHAAHRLEGTLRIGGQEHFYLEGQVAMAVPLDDGGMLVLSSTQYPSEVQHCVAKMLDLPDAMVTCECRRMGGGFGGKESQAAQWAALAALAARLTGRPAKCRLDRDDDMIMTGKRHDMRLDWRTGFDAGGRLEAVDAAFQSRCGYSVDLSLGVNDRTLFHADNAYFYPAARIVSNRLRTNTVSNTAFRGFGGPQGMLLAERLMDAIAYTLRIDPLDVRKRNLFGPRRDTTIFGQKVADNILLDLIGELERTSDYRARREAIASFNASSPYLKTGIALTPVKFGIAFTLTHLNQAGALVHVYTDGSVQVNHGGTEMGQGLHVKVAQIVAEEFGVDPSRVKVTATRTDKVPNASPTAASSGSDLNGMAARNAALAIKARMIDFVSRHYQVPAGRIRFAGNAVHVGDKRMDFAELARAAHAARVALSSTGFFATPKVHWDRERTEGRPFLYFAYGAACSEVTIDTATGEMRVDRVDILHDAGRSLNPAVDLGQIEGGFVQGMGWLTTEELVYDDKGRLLTHAPSTYKIPTASDVPADFRVNFWQSAGNAEETIYRSKAVGEPPLMLALSVFSAIMDAISSLSPGRVPPLDVPATPESIMRAVDAMRGGTVTLK